MLKNRIYFSINFRFNSREDAEWFIRKQPWKKVVENPRLVRTEPCGNSETVSIKI